MIEGTIATALVNVALFHLEIFKLINPYIIYWPAKVPDKVDVYPAAKRPTPQINSPLV